MLAAVFSQFCLALCILVEASPFPMDCPQADLGEDGVDAADDPTLYDAAPLKSVALQQQGLLTSRGGGI